MTHLDITLTTFSDVIAPNSSDTFWELLDVKDKTFSFYGIRHENVSFYIDEDSIIFMNSGKEGDYTGLTLGKKYLIKKLEHRGSDESRIKVGICNDFEENRFYPLEAFRFIHNEFR